MPTTHTLTSTHPYPYVHDSRPTGASLAYLRLQGLEGMNDYGGACVLYVLLSFAMGGYWPLLCPSLIPVCVCSTSRPPTTTHPPTSTTYLHTSLSVSGERMADFARLAHEYAASGREVGSKQATTRLVT